MKTEIHRCIIDKMVARKFKFAKLVRDKIVDQIISVGNKPEYRVLSDVDYIYELKRKLVEESAELPRTEDQTEMVKELADLQEIIDSLLNVLGISKSEFAEIQAKKNEKAGGFVKKHYIDTVETSATDTKWVEYYLANPDKYPEIK